MISSRQQLVAFIREALQNREISLDTEDQYQRLVAIGSAMSERQWKEYGRAVEAVRIWYDDVDIRIRDAEYDAGLRRKLELLLAELEHEGVGS